MTNNGETVQDSGPLEALRTYNQQRQAELDKLEADFAHGLEVVCDLGRVNEVLSASARPDLAMTERAVMDEVATIDDLKHTNNFATNLGGFGFAANETDASGFTIYAGLRGPDPEEAKMLFDLGARGNYEQYMEYSAEQGLDRDTVSMLLINSHLARGAFMRMWVLFPELTQTIMARSLNTIRKNHDEYKQEAFVAYNLMAQLVDTGDAYVMREGENGIIAVDSWHLCR